MSTEGQGSAIDPLTDNSLKSTNGQSAIQTATSVSKLNLFCKALFGKELNNKAPQQKMVWRDTCPYKALSNYNISKVYCVFMFKPKAQTFGKPTLLGITAQPVFQIN